MAIENFMKRFALALMLLIGMIGYTGYGNTTSDPAENSTAVTSDAGDTVHVVDFVPVVQDDLAIDVVKTNMNFSRIDEDVPVFRRTFKNPGNISTPGYMAKTPEPEDYGDDGKIPLSKHLL